MNRLVLLASAPLRSRPIGLAEGRLYLFSILFAIGNLLVPLAVHTVPNAGAIWLPLFFFTLVAAWQFGFWAGLLVALVSPMLNHFLVGMPVAMMLPVILTKSVVLAATASLVARWTKTINLIGILAAVIAMQAAGFLVERFTGLPLAVSANLLKMAVPGMIILVFGGYVVLRGINHFLGSRENRS